MDVHLEDFAIAQVDPSVLAELGKHGILSHAEVDDTGKYKRSVAVALIRAPVDKVVHAVEQVRQHDGGFLNDVNMIHKFKIDPLRVGCWTRNRTRIMFWHGTR